VAYNITAIKKTEIEEEEIIDIKKKIVVVVSI